MLWFPGHDGERYLAAKSFVDCTGYGDLCAAAGAEYTEPNDYDVANSMSLGGVDLKKFYDECVKITLVSAIGLRRFSGRGKKYSSFAMFRYWNCGAESGDAQDWYASCVYGYA